MVFMVGMIPETLLLQFGEKVSAEMGLHFPRERLNDLERGVAAAAKESGVNDTVEYIHRLLALPLPKNQVEFLASHLTVGETYFFREARLFRVLQETILPQLIRSHETDRLLRFWSAGCCTGEEPYSLAILLKTLIPHIAQWNITIHATDINPQFLQKAAKGIYSEWSLRETPQWIKNNFFKPTADGRFTLDSSVRKMVSFSSLNLAEDVYPSLMNNTNAMNLIFCRNVLMYFTAEPARYSVERLHRSLVDGGWLIVSPSETSHILFSRFATVDFGDVITYRKAAGAGAHAERINLQPIEIETPEQLETPEASTLSMLEGEPINLEAPSTPPKVESYSDALMLYNEGRYDESTAFLRSIIAKEERHAQAMALLARAYANQGNFSAALEWCQRSILADKLNPVPRYLLATIFQEYGQPEQAAGSLKNALYLDPHFILAHVAMGNILQQQGKTKEAIRSFRNAFSSLEKLSDNTPVPESEGLMAGRLRDMLNAMTMPEIS